MKEIYLGAGERIERACDRLAREAPAFMVFNGVRVESRPGETAGDLHARWSDGMDQARDAYEAKRRAYEQTPEGKAELAAAAKRADDENRAREETLRSIETSGVREKYPWEPGMGEISGFGGGYESACRDMLYAGLAWLDAHPGADLKATTYRNVFGILNAESADAKAIEKAMLAACPDCSGAMHQATMSACIYISREGWRKYVEAMSRKSKSG
jgi:hypothetical protein